MTATETAPCWPDRVNPDRLDGLLRELSVPIDAGRDELAVVQPTTDAPIGSVPLATEADLDDAFERGAAAAPAAAALAQMTAFVPGFPGVLGTALVDRLVARSVDRPVTSLVRAATATSPRDVRRPSRPTTTRPAPSR